MTFLPRKTHSLSRKLCLTLVLLLLFNAFAVSAFATNGEELLGEISDEITTDYIEDVSEECTEEDTSAANPSLNVGLIPDIEIDNNINIGGDTVSPNAIPTAPFSNACISLSATDVMLEQGEEYKIRYALEDDYVITCYFEGEHLFTHKLDYEEGKTYIALKGTYPGDSMLMVHYAKWENGDENGDGIIGVVDEGHVMINIRVQPKPGYVLIKNMDSKRYIDVPGSKTASGTKTALWSRNQSLSPNQVWRIIPQGDGTAIITSALCSYGTNHLYLNLNSTTGYAEINNTTSTSYLIQYHAVGEYYTIKPCSNISLTLATESNGTSSGTYIKFVSGVGTSGTIEWDLNYDIEGLCGVPYVPVTGISITAPATANNTDVELADAAVKKGSTVNFSAAVSPSNATKKTYKWSSSNSNILSINATTGVAQAKAEGIATVTVTSDVNQVKDRITVYIYRYILNVDIYYDEAFVALCNQNSINVSTFISQRVSPVISKYEEEFNIGIIVNDAYSYYSAIRADCPHKNSYYSVCECGPTYDWRFYNLDKTVISLMQSFAPTDSPNNTKLLFTGHYTESKTLEEGKEYLASDLGYTKSIEKKTIVTINPDLYKKAYYVDDSCGRDLSNTDLLNSISSVLAHELGHLFGVQDHDKGSLTTGQSHNCIWGENKNSKTIYADLDMCTSCKDIIANYSPNND